MDEKKEKPKKESRARETLFRVAYQHQGQLIQLADYKANLIISIGATIISGIVALVGFGFASNLVEKYRYLLITPAVVIVLACLAALIYAIQAAKPKFVSTHVTKTSGNKSSILFFRSIASFSQHDYIVRMKELLENEDDIFEQMTIDLYNQGIVLKRKYDLLRNAYSVLMVGFVASVVAFLVMLMFQY